jgi:magnesium transporter
MPIRSIPRIPTVEVPPCPTDAGTPSRLFSRRTGDRRPHPAPPELSMDPRATAIAAPVEQSVVSSAIYPRRVTLSTARPPWPKRTGGCGINPARWPGSGCTGPAETQLLAMAEEFGLHELKG